jgi:isopropylmalate/homocitrate/citramalate synthase
MLMLYDDTLRDGEQMAGLAFSPAQKLALAQALAGAGVRVMQIGFPASGPGELDSCASLLKARRQGRLPRALEMVLMARPDEADLDACLEACHRAGEDPARVTVLVLAAVSETHLRHKLGRRLLRGRSKRGGASAPLAQLRRLAQALAVDGVRRARALGFGKVEAALEDASRAEAPALRRLALALRDAGADRIAFCDTCGVLTPEKVQAQLVPLAQALGVAQGCCELAAHFHDDYGLAAVNTVQAALAGATHLTVTLNGLGERAGNAALHRVVLPLRDLYGVSIAGFKYRTLRRLSALAEATSGCLVPVQEMGVGRGAFRHESGLHAAALLSRESTYQALRPQDVGGKLSISYGKHSGQAAVRAGLRRLGPRLRRAGVRLQAGLAEQVARHLKARAQALAESPCQRGKVRHLLAQRDRLDEARCFGEQELLEAALEVHRAAQACA